MNNALLISVRGKDVLLTSETMRKTRKFYFDNAIACMVEALSGDLRVNDIVEYIKWRKQHAIDALNGKNEHTFAFIQMAYYIQSGESIPLLG